MGRSGEGRRGGGGGGGGGGGIKRGEEGRGIEKKGKKGEH